MDHWTMDVRQYESMRNHILNMIDDSGDAEGTITVKEVVEVAQDRFSTHELFPKGRVRNYYTFTKVDMEARCEIERVPGKSPQRIKRWTAD
ncbi:MAG: hypothetical protein H7145_06790 [Akkermansiaceae bacterium]|nr:hypothetical protein [Armatimonadota bacterium]